MQAHVFLEKNKAISVFPTDSNFLYKAYNGLEKKLLINISKGIYGVIKKFLSLFSSVFWVFLARLNYCFNINVTLCTTFNGVLLSRHRRQMKTSLG